MGVEEIQRFSRTNFDISLQRQISSNVRSFRKIEKGKFGGKFELSILRKLGTF